MLTELIKNQIRSYSKSNIPNEICGLLAGLNSESLVFYPCKNTSLDKTKHFQLDCYDYLRVSENNKIFGLIHSQEDEVPSDLDVTNKLGHNLSSFLYSWKYDKFVEITEKHLTYEKYLGIPFKIGDKDCFELIRSFYKNEYGISITNYWRDDNLFKKTPNIIKENYEKEGFREVNNNELKEGDILVFKNGHFGIYLEGDLLLHHWHGRLSNIEQFTEVWKRLLSNIYRHKNF